jgi:uncharacterized MAPEG superfamily protein
MLKRILLYLLAAVLLGVLLILVPLIAATEVKTSRSYLLVPEYVPDQLQGTRARATAAKNVPADLEVLVFSIVVASIAYLWTRRRIPHDERGLRSQYRF